MEFKILHCRSTLSRRPRSSRTSSTKTISNIWGGMTLTGSRIVAKPEGCHRPFLSSGSEISRGESGSSQICRAYEPDDRSLYIVKGKPFYCFRETDFANVSQTCKVDQV